MTKVVQTEANQNIKIEIKQLVDQLGGFASFINKGDVVLVKPNYNTADPPPASTDFEFLKAVIELIYEHDPKLVIIGESSTMTLNTRKVLEKRGVYELLKLNPSPRIVVFEEKNWVKKEIPDAKFLKKVKIPEVLDRVDKIILLPSLKTHFVAQFTGSLKLGIGFMKPHERVALHMRHLQEKTAVINMLYKPDLIIMDARKCFITKGPDKGEMRKPNLLLASTSRVDIDVLGIKIIQSYKGNDLAGVDPYQLPQIKRFIEITEGFKNERG
jgi:uncharacterized protein (DUF362 family)